MTIGSVSNRRHAVNGVCIKIYKKFMSVLSDRLRELRGDTSQVEMARQLGIQRTQWIKYETGTTAPGSDILAKICRAHACSADWLLGLKDSAALSVHAGDGAAVAIGANAKANAAAKSAADCRSCPYKKWGEKLRKQGLIIPGVE